MPGVAIPVVLILGCFYLHLFKIFNECDSVTSKSGIFEIKQIDQILTTCREFLSMARRKLSVLCSGQYATLVG